MTYEMDFFTNPSDTKDYLRLKLGSREREVFAVLYLSNRNQLISYEELFLGTIDGASIYVREIVKLGLSLNAASIICAHNHPSPGAATLLCEAKASPLELNVLGTCKISE